MGHFDSSHFGSTHFGGSFFGTIGDVIRRRLIVARNFIRARNGTWWRR